jgi:indolepyruvate ferredoxin oxidoreductase beta subunit
MKEDLKITFPDLRIIISGVGGQGTIFLTRMIGETMIRMGRNVISSEAHGLARMLGAVSSMIRVGDHSSGSFEEVDLIISMEPLEALRHSHLLAGKGMIITSRNEVRIDGYPRDIYDKLNSFNALIVDTKKLSEDMKEIHSGFGERERDNVILYGVFCKRFRIPEDISSDVIKSFKDVENNIVAFRAGFGYEF